MDEANIDNGGPEKGYEVEDKDIDMNRENMSDANTNSKMISGPEHTLHEKIKTIRKLSNIKEKLAKNIR